MTAAAMALIRTLPPASGLSADPCCEAMNRPPRPAGAAETTNTEIRTRATLTPARRAASTPSSATSGRPLSWLSLQAPAGATTATAPARSAISPGGRAAGRAGRVPGQPGNGFSSQQGPGREMTWHRPGTIWAEGLTAVASVADDMYHSVAVTPHRPDLLPGPHHLRGGGQRQHQRPLLPVPIALAQNTVEDLRETLGPEHPFTLNALANLANTLAESGRLLLAQQAGRSAWQRLAQHCGAEHPDPLAAQADLAVTLRARGEAEEAGRLHGDALRGFAALLGDEHPDTLAVRAWQRVDRHLEPQP
ncbi:tetratricopeptide repeat protein [Kitasatospora sp. NPDC008115]|uniref:tetratricopeptide repeat protein n=1 Tax=Kitasatospora sp. NPDC008115 TaxID=3364022 RepID=UPI0036E22313